MKKATAVLRFEEFALESSQNKKESTRTVTPTLTVMLTQKNNQNQKKNQKKNSKKQRNKPKLSSKLHILEPSNPTGVGAIAASLPNRILGQGKRKVWVGLERCALLRDCLGEGTRTTSTITTIATATTSTTTKSQVTANITDQNISSIRPTLEGLRAAWVFKLRKLFRDECGTISPPALAFERWFQTNEMLYQEQEQLEERKHTQDAVTWSTIQNSTSASAADMLKADMVRASMDPIDAEQIVCTIYKSTAAASQDLVIQRKNLDLGEKNPSQVMVVHHRHTLDLCLSENRRHILKMNHEHYSKLLTLWRLNRRAVGEQISDSEQINDNDKLTFHNDLYSLLARYYSIQGPGFQAACPELVFDVLESGLGVQHECFASPLNCYFGSYCSAFDVDVPFGSSGSFWNFSPIQGGSFQANPPFVHHVMVEMVKTIESRLSEDNVPFSFVVVVPVWLEESSYQHMCHSQYKVKHWIIAKADHGFCDGAQHQRRDRYRVSPYDTAIFVLQNKAGRIHYVPSPKLEQELRDAFATGVPTDAAIQRRKRDGRGETDEDGGGGVYKGKKRNRTGAGVEQRKLQERQSKQKKQRK
jgi:phosphorylated CTD-interacting factor 1